MTGREQQKRDKRRARKSDDDASISFNIFFSGREKCGFPRPICSMPT
jgi:hypothetical protein